MRGHKEDIIRQPEPIRFDIRGLLPLRKSKTGKSQTPQQTTLIKPQPQVKNSDILDVDEAALLLKAPKRPSTTRLKHGILLPTRVGRKLLFSSQKLNQWIALGGDLAGTIAGNVLSSFEQMLNNSTLNVQGDSAENGKFSALPQPTGEPPCSTAHDVSSLQR